MDTKGWDIINVCSINRVNQQLQSNMSQIISSFHFEQDGIEISGDFDAWQIISGGSNSLLRFETPIKQGVLKMGTMEVDIKNIKPVMEMQLQFINDSKVSNVQNLIFNVEVIGSEPGDTTPGAVTVVTPDVTGQIDTTNVAWGVLNTVLPKLFLSNQAKLSYVFSRIELFIEGDEHLQNSNEFRFVETPVNLSISGLTDKSVSLTWDNPTIEGAITGYKIKRSDGNVQTSSSTFYEDSSLLANSTYSYSVLAYDDEGNESPESTTITLTTLAAYSEIKEDEYMIKIGEMNGKLVISLILSDSTSSVDLHYQVDNEGEQDVKAKEHDDGWNYVITNVRKGSTIKFSFTYLLNDISKATVSNSYTITTELQEPSINDITTIEEDDYSIDIVEGTGSIAFTFSPYKTSSYVDLHYTVNDQIQRKIKVEQNEGVWIFTLTNVNESDKINFSYTYTVDELSNNSPVYTYKKLSSDQKGEENVVNSTVSKSEPTETITSNIFEEGEKSTNLRWLAPKKCHYLYQETSKDQKGFLAILSVTTEKQVNDLIEEIDSTLLKEGYSIFLLISNELFLKNLILPELSSSFSNGTTDENFVYHPTKGTIGRIENNGEINCGSVKWGLETYHPKLTSLSISIQDKFLIFQASGKFNITGLAGANVTFNVSSRSECRYNPAEESVYFVKDQNPSISYKKHIPWYDFALGALGGPVVVAIIDIVIASVTSTISESVRKSLYSGQTTSFVSDLGVNFITWNGLHDFRAYEAGLSESFYIRGDYFRPEEIKWIGGSYNPDTNSIRMSWNLPNDNDIEVAKFEIFRNDNVDPFIVEPNDPLFDLRGFEDFFVIQGNIYSYKIRAIDTNGIALELSEQLTVQT
ncbi:TULIP family P47-like protein [Bacillus sp. SCS-151]|uniref:TULIP family P47-like protein n=1 Tax=Nanhaiella sioensis TaxID=3115293 RepID=UPI00397C671F